MDKLWQVFKITAPSSRQSKGHPIRYPKAILKLIWQKRKAWKKSLARHDGSREAYRVACNNVKKAINVFHAGVSHDL